jgi:hypothetical protein
MFGTKFPLEENGKFYWYLLKLMRIKLPTCEIEFIVRTIGILLQIDNKRCTLHSCSSYVEILKIKFDIAWPHFTNK